MHSLLSQIPFLRNIPNRNVYIHSLGNMHQIVCSSTCNSLKLKTAQMSINSWMDKCIRVYSHYGKLYSHEGEWSRSTPNNMNEPHKQRYIKEARHRSIHTVWFHLHKAQRQMILIYAMLMLFVMKCDEDVQCPEDGCTCHLSISPGRKGKLLLPPRGDCTQHYIYDEVFRRIWYRSTWWAGIKPWRGTWYCFQGRG